MGIIIVEGSNGTGKTTLIKKLNEKYDFISLKSVPDWYRKYLPFARSLEPELQKQVYMIGHEAMYYSLSNSVDNCILDRFFYSTIIRLNYQLGKSVSDTVDEIKQVNFPTSFTMCLNADKDIVRSRLMKRNNFSFDEKFFEYENEIYETLSKKHDTIIMLNTSGDFSSTIDMVEEELNRHKIYLKRR